MVYERLKVGPRGGASPIKLCQVPLPPGFGLQALRTKNIQAPSCRRHNTLLNTHCIQRVFGLAHFMNEEYTLYSALVWARKLLERRLYIVFCGFLGSQVLRTKNIHCIQRMFGLARFKNEEHTGSFFVQKTQYTSQHTLYLACMFGLACFKNEEYKLYLACVLGSQAASLRTKNLERRIYTLHLAFAWARKI